MIFLPLNNWVNSSIFGSGKLFRFASKKPTFYPPGGSGFIGIDDVVDMMIALMNSEIKNERFIAVSDNLSYRDILTKICKAMDIKPPTTKIKIWQLNILWRLDWFWQLISRKNRKLTRAQVASLKNRKIYDNQKAQNKLSFRYRSLDETISFCSEKFIEDYRSSWLKIFA